MHVMPMNNGSKATYKLTGTVLTFGETLSVDLVDHEADTETVVTVYTSPDGELTLDDGAYAAVIVIPPRHYEIKTVTEDGLDRPMEVEKPVAEPLNTRTVTLKLWALPEPKPEPEV